MENKFFKIINSLSNKQKLIVSIIFFIIMIIIFKIFIQNDESNPYVSSLDYDNINYSSLMQNYYENYANRNLYLQLKNIFISYNENNDNDNYIKDVYNVALEDRYKKYISKNEFRDLFNSIFSKYISENKMKLYRCNDVTSNAYMCEIYDSNEKICGYIGLTFDSEYSYYNIFYLEEVIW